MMEDDYVCEYDSTWDTESDGEEQQTAGRPARRQDKNKTWALVRTTRRPFFLFPRNAIEPWWPSWQPGAAGTDPHPHRGWRASLLASG